MLPPIKTVLSGFQKEELAAIREEIDGLEDIYQLIDEAIVEEPPISIREGGMIKDQFDETIDHLRAAKHDGKQWLVHLKKEEIPNAIAVPSEAIVPEMGKDKIYLYKDGKAQPVEILTGIRTEAEVQVLRGLQVGDTIITSGTLQLRTGLPVTLDNID